MNNQDEKTINCSEFEELLTDYLDNVLSRATHKSVGSHALRCPMCHALLNEVKGALQLCREISVPKTSMTKLEARILSMTAPETAMACEKFEEYLTDYLDGFLPAPVFHRWERHAVLCEKCTDLPGEVVRSIAVCYTYKLEELSLPVGLHDKILQATIGTTEAEAVKASWSSQAAEWIRGLSFPISIPQLAPVAMIMLFAVLIFSQTVSADGSISGMYQKSFELAGQTYQQSTDIMLGNSPAEQKSFSEPINGTFINNEDK
ncbi:MAG: zf-HC2 domain-containing protein [Acidobacteriota bacterium]|jgi:anti-sigma factor RsiW|nr:zf-HC2 domain-containing protein [Acidobacteriota bacterium]